MTEDTAYILLWMLIVVTFGFLIGWAFGEELGRRRCAEEKVEDLQGQLKQAGTLTVDQRLRLMHGTLNDAHKRILALVKYINPD